MPLYRVRFQYGWTIDAPSAMEARKQAVERIKKVPDAFIASVEDATLAKPGSIWLRLLTGR